MNKFKIIKINVSIFALIMIVSLLFISNKAYAVIGQSYNSMVAQYGQPESIPLNRALINWTLKRYKAKGITVSAYTFQINGYKMTALFNASNVCYEMSTSGRIPPDLKDLIGSLANTKPVGARVGARYGTGANAVIVTITGGGSTLWQVRAYSPSLRP
jgi:hypothetical protein